MRSRWLFDAQVTSKSVRPFLPFYRFAIDQAGVATVIQDIRSYVQGILWSVTQNDIKNLDRYEGVAQNCYRKEYNDVIKKDRCGTVIEALVYVSCRPEWDKPSGTGSEYMRRILRSAYHHGFREEYVKTLTEFDETDNVPDEFHKSAVETV